MRVITQTLAREESLIFRICTTVAAETQKYDKVVAQRKLSNVASLQATRKDPTKNKSPYLTTRQAC
ncbi:hypothetical protein O5290_31005, partial [Escherichia coli]|nr:hypothetical protein [Escherichia coli]